MICKKCGYEIEKEWKYCPNCRLKLKVIGILPAISIITIILIIIFGILAIEDIMILFNN